MGEHRRGDGLYVVRRGVVAAGGGGVPPYGRGELQRGARPVGAVPFDTRRSGEAVERLGEERDGLDDIEARLGYGRRGDRLL